MGPHWKSGGIRARKWGQALALTLLLFGPLTLGEFWVRGQLDLLYRYMIPGNLWPDLKLLLLERAGCPQVLGLGSSVTNRTIVAELVAGESLPSANGESTVERVFAFGLNKARTTHLYAAWRHIHARGCTPDYVFVEVLPSTLNGYDASRILLEPFLDAVTVWKLPSGFAQEAKLGWAAIADSATWGRLLLHRLRASVSTAVAQTARLEEFSGLDLPLPLDGMIRALSPGSLEGEFAEERQERLRLARLGEYRLRPSQVQDQALAQLVVEASDAGARVILHSPPVTSIYREIVDPTGGHEMFCRARARLGAKSDPAWYSAYDGAQYTPEDFMDWNHLNRLGAKRYVRRLFRAVRAGKYPDDRWCRDRAAATSPEPESAASYPEPIFDADP